MEGQYFKQIGKLVPLSMQYLADCDKNSSDRFIAHVFEYIKNHGICREEDYPHSEIKSQCKANSSLALIKISKYNFVKKNDEKELQKAIANIGPISVAIDVSQQFQFYQSGKS